MDAAKICAALAFHDAPLCTAAGSIVLLEWVHEQTVYPLLKYYDIAEAASAAAANGRIDVLRWYVRRGIRFSVSVVDSAVATGDLSMVLWLAEMGYHAELICCKAIEHGHVHIAEQFQDNIRGQPHSVRIAAMRGHYDMIRWLHSKAVQLPLDLLLYVEHYNIAQFLVEIGIRIPDDATNNAAAIDRLDILCLLIAHGAECSTETVKAAARHGHVRIVEYLIELGISIGDALASASAQGHVDIMRILLRHDSSQHNRELALNRAIANCHEDAINLLVNAGTRPNEHTATYAAYAGDVRRYMQCMALIRKNDDLPIEHIIRRGHLHMLKILMLSNPPNISTFMIRGAFVNGHLHILQWLHEERHYDFATETHTYLHTAIAYGHIDICRWLNGVCDRGNLFRGKPLIDYADGRHAMIKYLQEMGCTHIRALHTAICAGDFELVRHLAPTARRDDIDKALQVRPALDVRHIWQWLRDTYA